MAWIEIFDLTYEVQQSSPDILWSTSSDPGQTTWNTPSVDTGQQPSAQPAPSRMLPHITNPEGDRLMNGRRATSFPGHSGALRSRYPTC